MGKGTIFDRRRKEWEGLEMGGWGEISKSKAAAAGGPRKATQFLSSAEKRSVCVFRRCCSFRLSPSAFLYAESRPAAAARFYRLCCVARRGEGREEKIGTFFSFRHLAERERGSHCSFVKEKLPSKRPPKKSTAFAPSTYHRRYSKLSLLIPPGVF